MTNPNYTDISIVLDRSGSMQNVLTDTIGGFNKFLLDQQALPGKATLTFVQFNEVMKTCYIAKPLEDVPPLSTSTYIPSGYTALLDALGRTMTEAGIRFAAMPEADRPGKVLFVVLTDGHENASREFSQAAVADMIKKQREQFNWQFLFLGANIDAVSVAKAYNIPSSSSITYAGNAIGTQHAFTSMSASTSAYRSASMSTAQAVFTDEDREKQASAGL